MSGSKLITGSRTRPLTPAELEKVAIHLAHQHRCMSELDGMLERDEVDVGSLTSQLAAIQDSDDTEPDTAAKANWLETPEPLRDVFISLARLITTGIFMLLGDRLEGIQEDRH